VIELTTAMADDIENFYNPARRHSSLDYLTPDEYEDLLKRNPGRALIRTGPVFGVILIWSGCRDLNPGPLDPQVFRSKRCAVGTRSRPQPSGMSKVKRGSANAR
jgi:hypothetical protein